MLSFFSTPFSSPSPLSALLMVSFSSLPHAPLLSSSSPVQTGEVSRSDGGGLFSSSSLSPGERAPSPPFPSSLPSDFSSQIIPVPPNPPTIPHDQPDQTLGPRHPHRRHQLRPRTPPRIPNGRRNRQIHPPRHTLRRPLHPPILRSHRIPRRLLLRRRHQLRQNQSHARPPTPPPPA